MVSNVDVKNISSRFSRAFSYRPVQEWATLLNGKLVYKLNSPSSMRHAARLHLTTLVNEIGIESSNCWRMDSYTERASPNKLLLKRSFAFCLSSTAVSDRYFCIVGNE